jgi:hypothetical protein
MAAVVMAIKAKGIENTSPSNFSDNATTSSPWGITAVTRQRTTAAVSFVLAGTKYIASLRLRPADCLDRHAGSAKIPAPPTLPGMLWMAVHCDQSRGGVVKKKGVRQPEDCAPVRFR